MCAAYLTLMVSCSGDQENRGQSRDGGPPHRDRRPPKDFIQCSTGQNKQMHLTRLCIRATNKKIHVVFLFLPLHLPYPVGWRGE